MTYAPTRLLELRQYLKQWTGLSDNALGIIGDENHNGGYHHGWNDRRIVNGNTADYSWNESTRDGSHRTNAAAAIDIGLFSRLRELSNWLVGQCEAQAPDTQDIRSIIYSPDGKVVKRWDRLRRRDTGDSSHLTHTHVSFFRDAEAREKISPFRRFFEGGKMDQYHENAILYTDNRIAALIAGDDIVQGTPVAPQGQGAAVWPVQSLRRIEATVSELLARPPVQSAPVDPAQLAAVIKPMLDAMESRLRAEIRDAVADLGEGGAKQVRGAQ